MLAPLIYGPTLSERWTRLISSRSIHQTATLTWPDRYPRLFAAARDMLGEDAKTILSFGCSSGEEVVTLAGYFPDATIVGAELNRVRLAQCRRLPPDPRHVFIHSDRGLIASHGPYDAIFCMAVLQSRPHEIERKKVTNLSRYYPFDRFEDEVGFLVGQLRPGGLFVAEHCHYLVEDTRAFALLEPDSGGSSYPAKGPRFDRAGQLMELRPLVSRIFRRQTGGAM